MSIGEILAAGGQTILIGLGIVFLILLILIGMIKILTAAMASPKKQAPAATPAPKAPVPAPTPVSTPVQEDAELIAVIAAAVAAIATQEGSRLRVRSVRRVGQQAPAWSRAAR